jgi:sensor domain CHASE-containing protein
MKLRNNTLLIVGVTIISLILILYVVSNFIFVNTLFNVEEELAYNNVGIVNNYLFKELSELNDSSYKWGELGYFSPQSSITDKYTAHIISGSQVDYIIVLNANNQVEYAKSFNSSSKTFNNISKNVQRIFLQINN